MSDNPELNQDPVEEEKPKRSRKTLLIIGAILILCCLGAAVAVSLSNTDTSESADPEQVAEESADDRSSDAGEVQEAASDDIDSDAQDDTSEQQDLAKSSEESESVVEETDQQEEAAESQPEPTATLEPTLVPTETPAPTPTPLPVGLSRANPFGPGDVVSSDSWEVQVLETVRGEEAWQQILAANQFNDPPPEGMEYLSILIYAKNISAAEDAIRISDADFNVTGEDNILYDRAYVSGLEPELEAELFSDGETEGWITYLVREDEHNLMLVHDELFSFDEDDNRYVALEEGASVVVDSSLYEISPTTSGLTRQEPVPLGETVTTEEFEVTIKEVRRGDDVYNMLLEANQFNDPPDEGMVYMAALIHAKRIGTADRATEISYIEFDPTGSANILYERPSVVEPDDRIGAYLFPGGEAEGWYIFEVPADEANIMLAYEPLFSFDDEDLRFLAIDENASVAVPDTLSEGFGNDIGEEKSAPAPLGETVNTGFFEFTVTDVIKNNDALAFVQQSGTSNDPPDPGMDYVAVRMKVRRVDPTDDWTSISGSSFEITGDNGVVYDRPLVFGIDPRFDVRLFPDGEYEGWAVYQVAEGEGGLMLIYDTLFNIGNRYFALE